MKVYIASRWSQRQALHDVRKVLAQYGYQVVSSWIDETDKNDFSSESAFHRRLAIRDLVEITSADVLILDESVELQQGSGGGREVEFGFALGQFQFTKVWIVGEPHNPFHFLAEKVFANWKEVYTWLNEQSQKS